MPCCGRCGRGRCPSRSPARRPRCRRGGWPGALSGSGCGCAGRWGGAAGRRRAPSGRRRAPPCARDNVGAVGVVVDRSGTWLGCFSVVSRHESPGSNPPFSQFSRRRRPSFNENEGGHFFTTPALLGGCDLLATAMTPPSARVRARSPESLGSCTQRSTLNRCFFCRKPNILRQAVQNENGRCPTNRRA